MNPVLGIRDSELGIRKLLRRGLLIAIFAGAVTVQAQAPAPPAKPTELSNIHFNS